MLPFDPAELTFLEPARLQWLWWILPAVVLLHLVRRKVTTRLVGHLPLWERALRRVRRRRPSLMRLLVSLLLQLLLFTTLVALWARPVVEEQRAGEGHTVLIVDRSLGTRALVADDGPATLADATIEAARGLAREALEVGTVAIGWWREDEIVPAGAGTGDPSRLDDLISRAPEPAGARNPDALLALDAAFGRDVRVAVVTPFDPDSEDRTAMESRGIGLIPVSGARPNGGIRGVRRGEGRSLVVRLEQPGPGPRNLVLRVEGRTLSRLPIPPGESPREVRIERPADPGIEPELALVPADSFPEDDVVPLALERDARRRVLVASAGRTPYLDAWLRSSELVSIDGSGRIELDGLERVADYDVGIVCAEDLPQPLPAGRWLILGALAPGLPIESAAPERKAAEPVRHDDADPLVQALDLRTWRLERAPKVTTRAGAEVVVQGSRGPLIVRGRAGEGVEVRFVWIAVPPDPAASTLPLTPAFPLILDAALRELTGGPRTQSPLVRRAGDAIALPLDLEPRLRDRAGRTLALPPLADGTGHRLPERRGRFRIAPFDRRHELTLAFLDHPGRPGRPLTDSRPLDPFPETQGTSSLDPWFLGLLAILLLLEWLSYHLMVTD